MEFLILLFLFLDMIYMIKCIYGRIKISKVMYDLTAYSYSYMTKYLRISSCNRKPFLIYDFATDPIWISLFMRKMLVSFLSVWVLICLSFKIRYAPPHPWCGPTPKRVLQVVTGSIICPVWRRGWTSIDAPLTDSIPETELSISVRTVPFSFCTNEKKNVILKWKGFLWDVVMHQC